MYGYLFDSWVNYLTILLSFTNLKIILICFMFSFILSEYSKICTIRRTWCIHAYEPIILELLNYLHVCCFNFLSIFFNFTVFKESNVPPPFFSFFLNDTPFYCNVLISTRMVSYIRYSSTRIISFQTLAFVLFVYVF